MKVKKTITKKNILIYVFTVLILLTLIPFLSVRLFPQLKDIPHESIDRIKVPDKISLYRTDSNKTESIDFEAYVKGVVASEMPRTFDKEALKAQAVASRTYALGKVLAGDTLCDSTHCQAYRADNISAEVSSAVEATKGQLVYYKGKLAAHTLYFSSSGGKTENSEDVFGFPYGYLKSVKSNYESGATHKNDKKTMKLSDFSKLIKKSFPNKVFGTIKKANIKILQRSAGSRVLTAKVGNVKLKGTELRTALGLKSTLFSIRISSKIAIPN